MRRRKEGSGSNPEDSKETKEQEKSEKDEKGESAAEEEKAYIFLCLKMEHLGVFVMTLVQMAILSAMVN